LAAIFELLIAALPPRAGRPLSCGDTLSFVEDVSEHVVGDVGHADGVGAWVAERADLSL
jgi:hypothetical protein